MSLTQILKRSCIKVPLDGKDKKSVISELIDLLGSNNLLSDKAAVLETIMLREQTRSTGIGSNIAIPHGKCKAVKELVMALGITAEPIDFESVDDKPVTIIILLVSPENQTGPHIQALANISRLMLDNSVKKAIEKATSAEDIYKIISEKEK